MISMKLALSLALAVTLMAIVVQGAALGGVSSQAGVRMDSTTNPSGTVIISERGLAAGSDWSVALGSTNQTAQAGQDINFTLPYGNYSFDVFPPTGYASASRINLTLGGPQEAFTIYFTPSGPTYPIYFSETGLPQPATAPYINWGVYLNGAPEETGTTGNVQTLIFHMVNGTYAYNVFSTEDVATSPSGNISVTGNPAYVNVTFVPSPASNVTPPPLGTPGGSGHGSPTISFDPYLPLAGVIASMVAALLAATLVFYRIRGPRIGKPSNAYREYVAAASGVRSPSADSRGQQNANSAGTSQSEVSEGYPK
jgi:hypothetical protein